MNKSQIFHKNQTQKLKLHHKIMNKKVENKNGKEKEDIIKEDNKKVEIIKSSIKVKVNLIHKLFKKLKKSEIK
jgi:hypothetical protein